MATVDVQPAAAAINTENAAEKTSQDANVLNGEKSEQSTSKVDGHSETVEQSAANGDQEKSEDKSKEHVPSERVQAARVYNSRDRTFGNRRKTKDEYKKNIKSDFSSQKETDDPVQIRKQVEFYFSDSNLLTDAFLFKLVDGPTNKPVQLSTIHSFKRMRRYQPISAVVSALKDSSTLNLIEQDPQAPTTSKDGEASTSTVDTTNAPSNPTTYSPSDLKYHIQRKTPLPASTANKPLFEVAKVHESDSMARSIYAKGFGHETPSTQFDIEAFFSQFGLTRSVRLRRQFDKNFKGSAFVEFDNEDLAKGFLEKAKKGEVKWQEGKELKILSKKAYCDEKVEEIKKGNVRRNSPQRKDDGDGDSRDWRTRRDEDRKSGFRDRGGRGGRGRGRGGRGGGRDRDNYRNRDRAEPPKIESTTDTKADNNEPEMVKKEEISTTEVTKPDVPTPATAPSKKRAREEDSAEDQPTTTTLKAEGKEQPSSSSEPSRKKLDTKTPPTINDAAEEKA